MTDVFTPFTLPLRREGDAAIVDAAGETVLVIDPDRRLEDNQATAIADHVFALSAPAPSSLAGGEDEIALIVAQACLDYASDTPSKFSERTVALGEITKSATHRILAALSPEAPAREGVVSAWAVAAEKAASTEYASHMGDPDGRDDVLTAQMAAARVIEAHAVAALTPRHEAPAEGAGEAARIIACHLPIPETPDTVCLPITITAGDLRAIYAALRARSSAPEAREAGSVAVADIAAERQRQIDAEGWTPEHDDEHGPGELALAAAAYAEASTLYENPPEYDRPPQTWPFERAWFKPQGARRDLVRAGALIVADIERIDRAASTEESA